MGIAIIFIVILFGIAIVSMHAWRKNQYLLPLKYFILQALAGLLVIAYGIIFAALSEGTGVFWGLSISYLIFSLTMLAMAFRNA